MGTIPISKFVLIITLHFHTLVVIHFGLLTLSLPRARQTILHGHPDDLSLALWRFALTDSVAAELREFVNKDAFVDMFEYVMNMGANTAPCILKLVDFTSVWVNSGIN